MSSNPFFFDPTQSWSQIGTIPDQNDRYGQSNSINGDGSIIAVADDFANNSAGEVKVLMQQMHIY